jgi:hypothetical protein
MNRADIWPPKSKFAGTSQRAYRRKVKRKKAYLMRKKSKAARRRLCLSTNEY